MKGIVFLGNRELELREFPDPIPGPREAVIELKASGMCGSDLHAYRRQAADKLVIAGHEASGVVVAVGAYVDPNRIKVGDRAIAHMGFGCNSCRYCDEGWPQNCTNQHIAMGFHADGAQAHYVKVPMENVVKLSDELSFKCGAAIACGTGTAFGAIKRSGLLAGESLAVFGQGPVGLSATLLAKVMGATVIALDVSEERLSMARAFGADHVLNPSNMEADKAIRDLTRGFGVDRSMECSSNSEARRQSVRCLKPWGTACFVGVHGEMTIDVNDIILNQVSIVGSLTFSRNMLRECMDLVADREINLEALFTHTFRLEDAVDAYALFDKQQMGKGVFLL
ncbi:zinc-dependent alcohol dehydrogenase family protein [Hoeflea poritis]|uniref:Zinc-binding dehydrogenase n=1 Tax=Hoeflea poritis TaxID=2993659 RepID=A0ABT4VUY9_9HYPH|nr:zinc-binding dehydrogenase [Hoeflea poritis]MDA4848537.1 zinc-binding dehydrogenase [Hoeflea poritis]